MKSSMIKPGIILLCVILVGSGLSWAGSGNVKELAGLWEAKRNFGPEVRGALTLIQHGGNWMAEIAGYSVMATNVKGKIHFKIPGNRGAFEGRVEASAGTINGHWIQPPLTHSGLAYASPVELSPDGKDRWRGEVVPLEDEFSLYLMVTGKEDGSVSAFLRNPDRNIGLFLNVDHLERDGASIKLMGTVLKNPPETVLAEGVYHKDEERLSLYIPNRGGTFDFVRADDESADNFYARGKNPGPYNYAPPPTENDGWPTAKLEDVGISIGPIKDLIEKVIEAPAESVNAPYIHGLLIARHGKLVVEEYFHGFHREKPHDTRSASKSLTSTLVGAAIQSGMPISVSSSVYDIIYGKNLPDEIDPRKKRMTVEHLLTMSSGFYCDDSDPAAPGNEDVMQEQTGDLDWYHYTLNLPMAFEPGEKSIYCSINPNLLGDVLISATGQTLPELFQDLIAKPLQIKHYYLDLQPTGQPYMGGGIYWMPREFMKLGQLLLNNGMWNGRRVLSKEWANRATSPLVDIRNHKYGYLWWLADYPYKGRTVRAFVAGGNGGQLIIGIPELDLLVAFFAGNYSDGPAMRKIQDEFVPQYILPALK